VRQVRPCRVGTGQLVGILEAICAGKAELADLDRLERLPAWSSAARCAVSGRRRPTPCSPPSSTSATSSSSISSTTAAGPRSAATSSSTGSFPGKCTGLPALRAGVPHRRHHRPAPRRLTTSTRRSASSAVRYEICRFDAIAGDAIVNPLGSRQWATEAKRSAETPIRAEDLPRANAAVVRLQIDHHAVEVPEASTVLRAAELAGVSVPSLCSHPELSPFGGCRLCGVEIAGVRGYPLACSTPVAEGMQSDDRHPSRCARRAARSCS